MRVHPTVISSGRRWQIPAVLILVLLAAGAAVLSGTNTPADGGSVRPPARQVVVVKSLVPAGHEIVEEDLRLERRPVSMLPADALERLEDAVGRITAGPVPAGYPLAGALLVSAEERQRMRSSDPAEETLAAIRDRTVSISVSFSAPPPARGSRVALGVQGAKGGSVLVADEAWIEELSGNVARVRVSAADALFLEEAKTLGSFSTLVIGKDGPSPFAGQAIKEMGELRRKLEMEPPLAPQAPETAPAAPAAGSQDSLSARNFSSYAWVTGSSVTYAVNEEGKLYVINDKEQVTPLVGYKRKSAAPGIAAAARQARQAVDGRRIEQGLR